MRTAKTLLRLGGCPGWSESLLGAQSHCWFCHVALNCPHPRSYTEGLPITILTTHTQDFIMWPWINNITPDKQTRWVGIRWYLTHICLVDPSILINWKSPFPILGVSGVRFSFLFHFELIFLLANSEDPDQMPHSAQKWDARLIWVKWYFFYSSP